MKSTDRQSLLWFIKDYEFQTQRWILCVLWQKSVFFIFIFISLDCAKEGIVFVTSFGKVSFIFFTQWNVIQRSSSWYVALSLTHTHTYTHSLSLFHTHTLSFSLYSLFMCLLFPHFFSLSLFYFSLCLFSLSHFSFC